MATGIKIDCSVCGTSFEFPEPAQQPVLNDYGKWEAPRAGCPGCKAKGIETIHMLNFDMPVSEFDPQEIGEEPYFPSGEYEKRNKIRDLMWKVRPDLKTSSRAMADQNARAATEKKYGKSIEAIRNERANARVNQRGNEA